MLGVFGCFVCIRFNFSWEWGAGIFGSERMTVIYLSCVLRQWGTLEDRVCFGDGDIIGEDKPVEGGEGLLALQTRCLGFSRGVATFR